MVETFFYLGCVDYVRPGTGHEFRFAKLDPLVRSTSDRSRWGDFVFRPVDEFPARGQVFWPDSPVGLEEGTYWQFTAIKNPNFNAEDRSEQYQIDTARQAIEIVDLRGRGDEAILRRLVTQVGIRTDPLPLSSHVLLHVDTEKWIGPVNIVTSQISGTWRISPDDNLTLMDCWRLPEGAANRVDLNGNRYFLAPFRDLGQHIGFVNWMSDVDLASGVLRRLRKIDRKALEALDTTYAVFEEYIAAVERAGLLGQDLVQELGRVERIRDIGEMIKRNKALLQVAVDTLLKSDTIRDELRDRKERFYRRLRRREQRKVENKFEQVRADLAETDELLEEGKREFQELKKRIEGKKVELDQAIQRYEDELTNRLRELAASPEKTFAEMVILRGLFGNGGTRAEQIELGANVGASITSAHVGEDYLMLGDSAEVLAAVVDRLNNIGFNPFLAIYLHIAFLAGAAPILAGSRAFEVLETYSSTVAGDRLLWIPVSASAFEPQELLGRFDPVTRRIIPHPGGLLAELTRIENDDLSVVALEGFNRAPIESYLLPLLGAHVDARMEHGGRKVPLFSPGLVDARDPFSGAAYVRWPGRTLLSMIPVAGAAVLPVSPEIWRYSVLIDTDRFRTKAIVPAGDGSGCEPSRVPAYQWASWQGSRQDVPLGAIEGFVQEIEQNFGSAARNTRDLIPRVYAAARACDVLHADAVRLILEVLILPSLHKDPAGIKQFLERNDFEIEDVDGILELVASIID